MRLPFTGTILPLILGLPNSTGLFLIRMSESANQRISESGSVASWLTVAGCLFGVMELTTRVEWLY